MQAENKLFASKAEGERYVLSAQSKDEADTVMEQMVKQQGMAGCEPCVPLKSKQVGGITVWTVPD